MEANTKLRKEQNVNLNSYLKEFFDNQLRIFKDRKDCNYDEISIRKQLEKRLKNLKDQFDKANNLINKFRSKYNLNEIKYTDECLYAVLNESNGDFKRAYSKLT